MCVWRLMHENAKEKNQKAKEKNIRRMNSEIFSNDIYKTINRHSTLKFICYFVKRLMKS